MRFFLVEKYDVADNPGRDGRWTTFARVSEAGLPLTLDKLRTRGYCSLSIDVTDAATGERLPEGEWPS